MEKSNKKVLEILKKEVIIIRFLLSTDNLFEKDKQTFQKKQNPENVKVSKGEAMFLKKYYSNQLF